MTNQPKIDLATKIRTELVEKNYYRDVKYNIISKSACKITGDITEAIAHILMGVTAILAFAAGFYDLRVLSFVADCLGTASLVLLRFSSYCMKESKERTKQVNKLLDRLGISGIPDITIDSSVARAPVQPANSTINATTIVDV